MNRNNRLYGVLAAGILTGLVLAVFVAFGWNRDGAEAAPAATDTVTIPAEAPADNVEALQVENQQLRAVLDTMQAREEAYQSQLETANQTILQMQQAPSRARYEEEDDDEYEEHEYEEHETGQHEYDD